MGETDGDGLALLLHVHDGFFDLDSVAGTKADATRRSLYCRVDANQAPTYVLRTSKDSAVVEGTVSCNPATRGLCGTRGKGFSLQGPASAPTDIGCARGEGTPLLAAWRPGPRATFRCLRCDSLPDMQARR